MKINAINQFKAGEILYNEGDAPGCLFMVLKGKVKIQSRGYSMNAGAGSLVGLEQLEGESSHDLCYAPEGAGVYVLNADNIKNLNALLASNKDYNGITIYNQANMLKESVAQHKRLLTEAKALYDETKDFYARYMELVSKTGCKATLIPEISQLEPFDTEVSLDDRCNAYLEYSKIPLDTIKAFYAPCALLTVSTLREMYEVEEDIQNICNDLSDYYVNAFMLLSGDENYSLYRSLLSLGVEMKKAGIATDELEELIGGCLARRDRSKELLTETTGRPWLENEAEIKAIYLAYAEGKDFREEDETNAAADSKAIVTVESLTNTMEQIFKFAMFPEDKAKALTEAVERYQALEDRDATDETTRKLRQSIAPLYYDLYYRTILEYLEGAPADAAIEMFLDFGLLSEKLLTHEQLVELASVKRDFSQGPCVVYSMSRWFMKIFSGEREPSRNSMGQDYAEMLREMRKQGTIDERGEKELLRDKKRKLEHEVKEVLMAGNRVVNGQLSIFVPFIHSGMFIGNLVKAYNSAAKINEEVKKLLDIDFSLFHRETLYSDAAGGIEREYLMKQVLPEFILFPMVGQNVIMWQEISGRKRDSEGRFFTPAFSYNNFDDMLIKACGRFRWDLCKTIQGPNWNNIQVHSLTSEYSDYIQFYKKNHDLSDERREKIKLQIQRGRNNLREIFTLDYEIWVKNESNGAMKLNKVVRDIVATYCPFAAPIRKKLISQPLYEEAFARDVRERGKRGRELQLKIKGLETKGVRIPEEIRETLRFFTEM